LEEDKRSVQVAKAFSRFLKTRDSSLVESITLQEIEKALLQYQREKGHPIYKAMEKAAEMRQEEQYRREGGRKWEERIVGFIAGLTIALLVILLRRYVFSP
jgi:hypothetical protein